MTGKNSTTSFLTIKHIQWVYLTVFVLLISPFIVFILYSDEIYKAYVRIYIAPEIRHQFGFKMDRQRMYYHTQPLDVFVITTVENGVLAKAGVKDNDIPLGLFHMSDVNFYLKLRQSQNGPIEIRLINRDEYGRVLREQDWTLLHGQHKVVIPKQ